MSVTGAAAETTPATGSAYLTVADALRGLRTGAVTATELLASARSVADAVDGDLGVYISRFDERAQRVAQLADLEYRAGDPVAPLLGIPLGVKDIISTEEGPTTAQSLILEEGWGAAHGDAPVVAQLRAAGAIITGKTTTMEFANGLPDPAQGFPLPRNPWNSDYWSGGSSSGTAIGVATGAFLAGLGTDTGGSIRLPAAFCGITGLKPTFGLVPTSGTIPLAESLDTVGPMARSAEDCAIILDAIIGDHVREAEAPRPPIHAALESSGGDLTGMRIGLDPLLGGAGPLRESELTARLWDAAAVLEARGATVVEVEVPLYHELSAATRITLVSEGLAYHSENLRTRWAEYGADTRRGLAVGAAHSGADYVQAQRVRRFGQRQVATMFESLDAVITPTAALGSFSYDGLHQFSGRYRYMHTSYWNALGNPALSVPIGFTASGLPLGMQIAAPAFGDERVLRIGHAYQTATAWHLAIPPRVDLIGSER